MRETNLIIMTITLIFKYIFMGISKNIYYIIKFKANKKLIIKKYFFYNNMTWH